jgi:hypothetical protein
MADSANDNARLAFTPPWQANAYGPPLGMPAVEKIVTPTARQIAPDDSLGTSIGTGITRRISE